jgi:cytochrome c oxidase subunit 1
MFVLVMMGAGTLGVPRRHWDIGFAGTALPYDFPGTAYLMMALVGISAVLAVVGGGMYILVTVWSVFLGKKIEAGGYSTTRTQLKMAPISAAIEGHGGGKGAFAAPGTFTLALVFLTAFVLYYFINWKYLSQVWGLS